MLSIATLEQKLSAEQRHAEKNKHTFHQMIKSHPVLSTFILSGMLLIGFKQTHKNQKIWRTLLKTVATRFILTIATQQNFKLHA